MNWSFEPDLAKNKSREHNADPTPSHCTGSYLPIEQEQQVPNVAAIHRARQ